MGSRAGAVSVARLRALGRVMNEFGLDELTSGGVTMRRAARPAAAPAAKGKKPLPPKKKTLDEMIDADPDFQAFEAGGG
jgi:hypothetical protein